MSRPAHTTLLLCLSLGMPLSVHAREISYNRDVQPILSENCFFCHGPDSASRKPEDAPLRLDLEEFAYAKREDGAQPFIPGDPENSYMIQLMESDDPHEVMPLHPSRDPAHGKVMAQEDIDIIKKWIAQGAKYEPHWAYVQPQKTPLPSQGEGWSKNAIDHFVAKTHAELEIEPNPQQDEHRLLRRLHLDLTGLPPAPEALTSFQADTRDFDTKYAARVDELLATNDYAEHQARLWMDVARYADTQGIHHDYHRTVWPYRDWLINAFASNMPFNQFTIEQLAGDLIPNATPEQKIATGYLRVMATSGEGGLIPEEYKAIYAQDRVDAMAAGWLGLTTNCASCHDHKFDQLSTKEVYELTAFFRNNTLNPFQGKDHSIPPYQFAPHPQDRETYAEIQPRLDAAQNTYDQGKVQYDGAYQTWQADLSNFKPHTPVHTVVVNAAKQFQLSHQQQAPQVVGKPNVTTEQNLVGKPAILLKQGESYEFPATDFKIPSDKPFALSFNIKIMGGPRKANGALFSQMKAEGTHRGWDVWLEEGRVMMHLINDYPKHSIKFGTKKSLPGNKWVTVTINYNGNSKAGGLSYYFDTNKVPHRNPQNDSLNKHDLSTDANFTINGRLGGTQALNNVLLTNIKHYDTQVNQITILNNARENDPNLKLDKEFENAIKDLYFAQYNEHTKPLKQALNKINQEFSPIQKRGGNSLIYGELADSDPSAHILIRGQYAAKGEKVYANTPAVLPPLFLDETGGQEGETADATKPEAETDTAEQAEPAAPADAKPAKVGSRLDLAKWLMRADNPLPSRVTVNRYWSYFFGQGLLTNNADFGAMGGHPSHPELIDWLARDLIESDWNLQSLIKTIVTSATYQQSGVTSEQAQKVDPKNRYLTRGPRYRLDAEQIRDMALSSSGLLSKKIGGPSVKPYQPDGHWLISMFSSDTRNYQTSKGEDLYRRSMYTYWKRQATHPVMDILNVPIRETFCVQREATNTPLQALTLMNEPLFVESYRHLATNALNESTEPAAIIDYLSTRLLARPLQPAEREIVQASYDKIVKNFSETPEDATKLLETGDSATSTDHPAPQLAAWTMIASQLFNLDETVTK